MPQIEVRTIMLLVHHYVHDCTIMNVSTVHFMKLDVPSPFAIVVAIAVHGFGDLITGILGSGGRTMSYQEAIGSIRVVRVTFPKKI